MLRRIRLRFRRALMVLSMSTIAFAIFTTFYCVRTEGHRPQHAYVFYATQDTYACSVLINLFSLRYLFHTNHRVIVLISEDISSNYKEAFADIGATVLVRAPPPLHRDSIKYYQGCLLKLLAFQLFDLDPPLERVIVMDSDQLILKDLDPAFDLPLGGILAPKAYWIDNETYSSTLMEFHPSHGLWKDVEEALQQVPADTYDMDIANHIFRDSLQELPPTYGTLNSHWEDNNVPLWMMSGEGQTTTLDVDDHLRELFSRVHVAHFTAVGKPWMYDVAELLQLRPNAHPLFVEQWACWRTRALQLCPHGIVDHV